MQWLVDLKIRHKILLVSLAGAVGFALYLALHVLVVNQNAATLERVRSVYFPALEKTDTSLVKLDKIKEAFNLAATTGEADMLTEADGLAAAIEKNFAEITALDTGLAVEIATLKPLFANYYTTARSLTKGIVGKTIRGADIKENVDKMQASLSAFENAFRNFRRTNYEKFTSAIDDANSAAARAVTLGLLIGVITLVSLGVIGTLISRLITDNIDMILRSLREISSGQGDLTKRLQSKSEDELGELVGSFNTFLQKLQQIIAEVLDRAKIISATSRQISEGNSNLSRRTESQASSLEETAANMEEMTGTVKESVDHTTNASNMANTTEELAQRSGDVIHQATVAMSHIDSSNKKIVDIIAVMDSIAFQTNLLALNAAVEAAHAGGQGHGFAVVANEVRALAQRSAASAQEVRALIQDSVEKVQLGTQMVEGANKSLQEIVASAKRMAAIVAEIAAASREQAVGIDQVNVAITEIDRATQENAALVIEVASASKSMEDQAKSLYQLLRSFKVAEESLVETPPVATKTNQMRLVGGGRSS